MTKMIGTTGVTRITGLAWMTKMNSWMSGMSGIDGSHLMKEPELILYKEETVGFRKLYLWKNPKQNVVVLYELRKLQKMIKLIPEMPEINNRGP